MRTKITLTEEEKIQKRKEYYIKNADKIKEYNKANYYKNADMINKKSVLRQKRNREQERILQEIFLNIKWVDKRKSPYKEENELNQRRRLRLRQKEELRNAYIKKQIAKRIDISYKEIPLELVELERNKTVLMRKIKQL